MSRTVGMPWYGREAYDEIRKTMLDGERLPASYAYWLSSAESVETAVRSGGTRVVRVPIEPAAFLAWCDARALPADGSARSRYASENAEAASAGRPDD